MKSLTKKQIEKAVREKHNLSPADIRLEKFAGYWWWGGDIVTQEMQSNTYVMALDDKSLDQWVAIFERRILPLVTKVKA